jgi:hypothetical protein
MNVPKRYRRRGFEEKTRISRVQKNKKGQHRFAGPFLLLEAASGFEPLNKGFADLCLTTWLRRLNYFSQETAAFTMQHHPEGGKNLYMFFPSVSTKKNRTRHCFLTDGNY